MTRDLRRHHRVMWFVLPVLLVVLWAAAAMTRARAERALAGSVPETAEGTR